MSTTPTSGSRADRRRTTSTPPPADVIAPTASPRQRRPSASPAPARAGELVQAPSNLTGICDRSIQPRIDAALDGTEDIAEVIDAVEPRLWNMSTVLPILQDTTIVAAGQACENVSLSGAVPVGIVGDAGKWVKHAVAVAWCCSAQQLQAVRGEGGDREHRSSHTAAGPAPTRTARRTPARAA